MTFYVYDINVKSLDRIVPMAKCIKDSLEKQETVNDRIMKLNNTESKDVDFIADWLPDQDNKILICSFIRLKKGVSSVLKTEDLQKKTIDISDIVTTSTKENAGSIKDTIFFAVYKNCMIISNQHSKAISTYLWWLFKKTNTPLDFEIKPRLNHDKFIQMQDVKSITIGENYLNSWIKPNDSQNKKTIDLTSLKNSILSMFTETRDFEEYGNIVSAFLTLKFNKKKINAEETAKHAMNLIEDDDIKLKARNGKTYTGSEVREKEAVDIDKTSEGAYVWPEIWKVLKELCIKYCA